MKIEMDGKYTTRRSLGLPPEQRDKVTIYAVDVPNEHYQIHGRVNNGGPCSWRTDGRHSNGEDAGDLVTIPAEQKMVPFTWKTVPLNAWFRCKGYPDGVTFQKIYCLYGDGASVLFQNRHTSFDQMLAEGEYCLDPQAENAQWLPCGTMEAP